MIAILSHSRRGTETGWLPLPLVTLSSVAWIPTTATSQVRTSAPGNDTLPFLVDTSVTQASAVATGRIGTRQTRQDTSRATGIKQLAKINNRISNRTQSRLRNHLDRNYSERPCLQ